MTTTRLAPYPPLTGAEPCRAPGTDPDTWFTAENENTARSLCRQCPVRTQCLAWALDHPQYTEHGIWAGKDTRELTNLRRRYARKERTS